MKVYFLHMFYVFAPCFVFISCIFFYVSMSARSYSFTDLSPPPFPSLDLAADRSPRVLKCIGFCYRLLHRFRQAGMLR